MISVNRINSSKCIAIGLLFIASACKTTDKNSEPVLFSLLDSTETNINFINHLADTDSLNILDYLYYYNGAGVAAGDVNNDGYTDLFFVSNTGKNKLYLNKTEKAKSLKFEDVSAKAGVEGLSDWQTGVTMADVNGDGWLDIYVCAVSDYKGLQGFNELYINNGVGDDGRLTFTEKAKEYNLAFAGFSTQAVFFDYDKDGDLDMYLLNHAVHTSRSYAKASTRNIPDERAGDYLFENMLISDEGNGTIGFKDVSKQAGIFQAAMGYGLGVAVADFTNDGWEDIYVSNDFHEDDYYYINNQDGTFTEGLRKYLGHVSRFSMGSDAADINNDGFTDLLTLDMYPEDETVEKSSAGEDPFDIFLFKLHYGYHFQYSRNSLQLNKSGLGFSDIGIMSGVSTTDWSWSSLIADYDNDGFKDIFITNGIVHRPNDLDFIKYISNDKRSSPADRTFDQEAISLMPEGKVDNYFFKGTGQYKFLNKSQKWVSSKPDISNGATYADFDNDGDIDLATNRINEQAGVYENHADKISHNHYLKIKLKGNAPNVFGVGAKVILKYDGKLQSQDITTTRGFLSGVGPILNFGLGSVKYVDTLIVVWSNQSTEVLVNVKSDSTYTLHQEKANVNKIWDHQLLPRSGHQFEDISDSLKISYVHFENLYYDFYKEPLIPFEISDEGPKIAIGDVDGDSLQDFFIGGAKGQAGKLFTQKSSGEFIEKEQLAFLADSASEDVDALFFDADGDKDLDLYVVSGGNQYEGNVPQLLDRIYINNGRGEFARRGDQLPLLYGNKSCVEAADFDNDGDIDLFVGGRVISGKYGITPDSYLLVNDGTGKFLDATDHLAPGLKKAGMVTDAKWFDWDNDGDRDLIVVGDWMPVRIFRNVNSKLEESTLVEGLEQSSGFWQAIEMSDFDNDGDVDFVVGNLGTNSRLRKSHNSNIKLYVKDIDKNGELEHILAYGSGNRWYPVATRDELKKQLPFFSKRFMTYKDFAGKTIDQIFSKEELEDAVVTTVDRFESIYLENLGTHFNQHFLPDEAQVSKIFAFHIDDYDNDGFMDVLLGGNLNGASMYQGRYDASYGLFLKGKGNGTFEPRGEGSGFFVHGEIRDIKTILRDKKRMILVARNNSALKVFRFK